MQTHPTITVILKGYLSIEGKIVNIFFVILQISLYSSFASDRYNLEKKMRIYGNRPLKTMPGRNIRPTPARVREALFQIWQDEVYGCRWLDICAGNGAMGAEALCRGASRVVGLELVGRACGIIRENWQQMTQPSPEFQIIRGDVRRTLKRLDGQQFDRIYFDPPYQSELYHPVLAIIAQKKLLAESGEMAVEYNPKFWHPEAIAFLKPVRKKTYGNTALVFFCNTEDCENL